MTDQNKKISLKAFVKKYWLITGNPAEDADGIYLKNFDAFIKWESLVKTINMKNMALNETTNGTSTQAKFLNDSINEFLITTLTVAGKIKLIYMIKKINEFNSLEQNEEDFKNNDSGIEVLSVITEIPIEELKIKLGQNLTTLDIFPEEKMNELIIN